jgi:hypothetical protein
MGVETEHIRAMDLRSKYPAIVAMTSSVCQIQRSGVDIILAVTFIGSNGQSIIIVI